MVSFSFSELFIYHRKGRPSACSYANSTSCEADTDQVNTSMNTQLGPKNVWLDGRNLRPPPRFVSREEEEAGTLYRYYKWSPGESHFKYCSFIRFLSDIYLGLVHNLDDKLLYYLYISNFLLLLLLQLYVGSNKSFSLGVLVIGD